MEDLHQQIEELQEKHNGLMKKLADPEYDREAALYDLLDKTGPVSIADVVQPPNLVHRGTVFRKRFTLTINGLTMGCDVRSNGMEFSMDPYQLPVIATTNPDKLLVARAQDILKYVVPEPLGTINKDGKRLVAYIYDMGYDREIFTHKRYQSL